MDIVAGLSAASKAIELAKTIKDIDAAFELAELKARAAELLSDLADVKISLLEAKEANSQKDEEIARLKASFALKQECVRVGDMSYATNATGGPTGRPFCPRCETIDGVMIKIVQLIGRNGHCPECKTNYGHLRFFA